MLTVCLLRKSKRHMQTLASIDRCFRPSQLLVRWEPLTVLVTLLRGTDEDFITFNDLCEL